MSEPVWEATVEIRTKSGRDVRVGDVVSVDPDRPNVGWRVAKVTTRGLPAPYGGTTVQYHLLDSAGELIGTVGAQGRIPVLVARLRPFEPTKTKKEG